MKGALAAASIFMLADAILSLALSTDRRPIVQGGRVLRGAAGLGLGIAALAAR